MTVAELPVPSTLMLADPKLLPVRSLAPCVQLQPPAVLYSGAGFATAVAVPVKTNAATTAATSS